ncbi:DUF2188 domain-containing protein [Cupriavidus pinatubonensis]|uniref:DUF2188 domain-containing protein n=1 Tax=Cupriavidus pinatubonensis TaxID=248026 RepID=A0ABM8X8U0_9BURK|nr:DUF2188 domain-containing protein [Cupriavidus pinatubonensis]CAG9176393.1 hypothetical protein LMG23994_03397 [Cupriavidus pinatubonensis]
MGSNLHVVPYRNGWDVIQEGACYAESHHATQEAAINAATALARRKKVDLLVHAPDGSVRTSGSERDCGLKSAG